MERIEISVVDNIRQMYEELFSAVPSSSAAEKGGTAITAEARALAAG